MDRLLAIGTLLSEVLMVLQCTEIVFKRKLRFDKYMVGMIVIDCGIYALINFEILSQIFAVTLYFLIFLYCYCEFKQTFVKTIIGIIVSFSLAGCIEGILVCISNLIKNEYNSKAILFLASVLALCLVYIIKKNNPLFKPKRIKKGDKKLFCIVIFYGFILCVLLIDYYINQANIKISTVIILIFMVSIFSYLHKLLQADSEIEKKNYELELQKIYGEMYEELLMEVRTKQHDFKNQLSAIYSMHLVARSLEELISMQREYGDIFLLNSKYDSILTCCNNSILAGYLYYRCISCENEGITVVYNIHIGQAECCFGIHELIEILGILIDNACENFSKAQIVEKYIELKFQEEEEKIVLSVSNPSEYIAFSQIEKMFVCGYSSKGEHRGLGLARVLELIKKYAAEINVSNVLKHEENWIDFMIEIKK